MKLEDALKQNPYDKTRGSKGAYIRYLRYTVDGWYSKKSEEIRKQIDWDKNNKDIAAKSACGTPQALILYAERQEI